MKVIIPMAGMGKRLRPHTLTIPKPLLLLAGKPIVQRLVEDIAKVCDQKIDEIAYVIGNFGKEVEESLKSIAKEIGAKSAIYYQNEALGTAHAIHCAKDSLEGKIVVAFADTLFKADFTLDEAQDGTVWVKKIDNPSAFGVVKLDDDNFITDFVEKPERYVSDLAIIGIYYFNNGAYLKEELQFVIDNDIKDKGEYQLTSALENMKQKGTKFVAEEVNEWLDCGNKDATVHTNQRILELNNNNGLISKTLISRNATIIEPCFIGDNVSIVNSTVGPHASVGDNTVIEESTIRNSIIQSNSKIFSANLDNSMIGNFVEYTGEKDKKRQVSIGDYSQIL